MDESHSIEKIISRSLKIVFFFRKKDIFFLFFLLSSFQESIIGSNSNH